MSASIRTIHAAHDLGVNFIDTRQWLWRGQSEIFVGKALADRRDKWVIATSTTSARSATRGAAVHHRGLRARA